MAKRWQSDLELHVPSGKDVSPETMAEFNNKNIDKIKEVEQFIQIFNDWHHEACIELAQLWKKGDPDSADKLKRRE